MSSRLLPASRPPASTLTRHPNYDRSNIVVLMSVRSFFVFSLAVAASSAGVAHAADPAPAWEKIIDERGIVVYKRAIPGSSLVEFRAVGSIRAPMIRAAAVLRNSGREREWMESCVEARVLEWTSPLDATIYNRTESPFFLISDRDLVAQARTTVDYEAKTIAIHFRSVEHRRAPRIDGVVRMPDVRGMWKFRRLDANLTELEYVLRADPGGAIPSWLVNWASERIPFNTILKLREQVKKPGYDQDEQILDAVIDFSKFEHANCNSCAADAERAGP